MADKELDPAMQQKVRPPPPPQFQPPNLLTSKASEPASARNNSGTTIDHHHDRYQSVSQKAKLILPTALWILIVVAGLCFLSLLSSLNKSITTLDTLVEIEQANEARNGRHRHAAGLKARGDREKDDDDDDDSAWLSLPGWTSLEPAAHRARHNSEKQKPHPDEPSADVFDSKVVEEMIDELLKDSPADKSPDSRGEIIIETSSSNQPQQKSKEADSELASMMSGFDSILKQFMGPMFSEKSTSEAKGDKDGQSQQATVVANIDTINIHLTGDDDDDQDKSVEKPTVTRKNRKPKQQQQADSLETTIEKMLDEIDGNQRNRDRPMLDLPETVLIPLGPSSRPWRPHHHGHNHNHNHHHHQAPIAILDDGASSPLKNLLLPPGLLGPMSPHAGAGSFDPFDSLLPPGVLNQRPGSEFIIQLGDGLKPALDEMRPLKKVSKSPYELMSTSGDRFMTSPKPAGIDFGSSLANSLLRQTLFPVQESNSNSNSNTKKETMGPFIISDMDLSAAPDQWLRKGTTDEPKNNMKNPINDLLSLFFGPPPAPNASLAVAPQVVEPKINTLEPASEDEIAAATAAATAAAINNITGLASEAETSSESASASPSSPLDTEVDVTKQMSTTPLPIEVSFASTPASEAVTASPSAVTVNNKLEDMPSDPLIEDIVGSMLSLPQMSGQSGPVRADSQQFGSGSSSSSNNNNNGATNNNRDIALNELIGPEYTIVTGDQ